MTYYHKEISLGLEQARLISLSRVYTKKAHMCFKDMTKMYRYFLKLFFLSWE